MFDHSAAVPLLQKLLGSVFVPEIPSCLSELSLQTESNISVPDKPQSSLYTASTLVPKIRQMSSPAVYSHRAGPPAFVQPVLTPPKHQNALHVYIFVKRII